MSEELTGGGSAPVESSPAVSAAPTTPDAALDAAFSDISAAPTEPADAEPLAPSGDVPAIEAPQAVEAQPGPEGKEGPIPFTVHKTALDNARTKAGQEAEARFQKEYGGALEVIRAMQSDLPGTLSQLLSEAVAHPQHGQAVLAHAARLLQGRRGTKAPEAVVEPEPQADLQTAEGELVYSAKQQQAREAWFRRQVLGDVEKTYGPIKQSFEQQQKQQQQTEAFNKYRAEADTRSKAQAETLKKLPFVEEHRSAINARQQEIFAEMAQRGGVNPHEAPMQAWLQAYSEIVGKALPARDASLQARTQQAFVTTAATKVRGSQSDPAASAPAQPRKARTPDEALDQVFSGHA
jgi:hypothetical protein